MNCFENVWNYIEKNFGVLSENIWPGDSWGEKPKFVLTLWCLHTHIGDHKFDGERTTELFHNVQRKEKLLRRLRLIGDNI